MPSNIKYWLITLCLFLPGGSQAEDEVENCFNHLYSKPELASLVNKLSLPNVMKATFEQIANSEKVSEHDLPTFSKLAAGIKICSDLESNLIPSDTYPPSRKAVEDNISRRIDSLIELHNKKISFGEFIRQRQLSIKRSLNEVSVADQEALEIRARLQTEQQASQNRAFTNALERMGTSIKERTQPPPVRCSTTSYGGTLQTTCR